MEIIWFDEAEFSVTLVIFNFGKWWRDMKPAINAKKLSLQINLVLSLYLCLMTKGSRGAREPGTEVSYKMSYYKETQGRGFMFEFAFTSNGKLTNERWLHTVHEWKPVKTRSKTKLFTIQSRKRRYFYLTDITFTVTKTDILKGLR